MRALLIAAALLALPLLAAAGDEARLIAAKQAASDAAARAEALDRQASAARDEAARARALEAAVAARVQRAEAEIAAAEARITLIRRALGVQRAQLARDQGPIVRLVAAIQSLARRPVVASLAQPGSVRDLVHVRAVLATAAPGVRAKTAAVRAQLQRTRRLEEGARLAVAALAEGRAALEEQRLALARLEASHRLRARALGRDALFESDRAIALGERARDLVDLMNQASDAAITGADLANLPGPLPRPPRPGEVPAPAAAPLWSSTTPPYRLPVVGRVVTGLGELSDNGVRSRGLTLAPAPGALVVAPAAGRVQYAARFRDYGDVVILDHGGGWTSLIAGLADVAVRAGDQLGQGVAIGRAGQDAPRITVELRRRNRAIDLTRLIG